jgi:hypothetical protein
MAPFGPPSPPAPQETPSVTGNFHCLRSAANTTLPPAEGGRRRQPGEGLHNFRLWCALSVLLLTGCGSTQLSAPNRHLLAALQTAISAKNTEWLGGVEKQVAEQRAKGAMSEAEFKAIDSILREAKAGQWETAQSRVFALSEAQRPTAEDLARVRERKSGSAKK